MAKAQDAAQRYVPPWMFSGSLYVATVDELSQHHQALLEQEFDASEGSLVCIGSDDLSPDHSPASQLDAFLRKQPWQSVTSHAAADLLESNLQQQLEKTFEKLDGDCCVWLDARVLAESDVKTRRWLGEQLRSCLKREVTVCLDRSEPNNRDRDSESEGTESTCEPFAGELDLLPQMQLLYGDSDASLPAASDRLSIAVPGGAWVRVHGRELFNLSQLSSLTFAYPENGNKRDGASLRLPPRAVCDLVAMRRALDERARPPFPADKPYDPHLENGSLVIVGGGGTSLEIWEKFIELAGGADAKIIVLPTAVPEPEEDPYEARVLHRLGVRDVRVLPQTERDEVSDPEYLKHFESATGIWFGGGRQWRFVDAYWGTPAWQAMIDVVRRGGVIGGSSAGATIQGDLLVRGHPLGNHIMIADGYRRGLGLLPGVAIDQHFRQRNRFDDLAGVVERFPSILGVGIDEDTALVVEAPSRCSVIGKGSVWLSRPSHGNEERHYIEKRSGSQFDLRGK
ncbi:MAG: cyanophycinase [Aureliella sp.]